MALAVLAGLSAAVVAVYAQQLAAPSALSSELTRQGADAAAGPLSSEVPRRGVGGLESLSPVAQAAASSTLGADDRRYRAHRTPGGFEIANPAHAITAEFLGDRVIARAGAHSFGLALEKAGHGSALAPLAAARPRAVANRVEYRRGRVTEWYVNGPLGLDQGFTIPKPLQSRRDGPLTLALRTEGSLRPTLADGRRALDLVGYTGKTRLRYRGLIAFDARGRSLPASLAVEQHTLLIRVADAHAHYPLTIDPYVDGQILQGSDTAASDRFGNSVAIDGNTLVVGAPLHDVNGRLNQGAAYVFVRSGITWTQQATLTADDGTASDQFGNSVAISGDTIVVGAFTDDLGSAVDRGSAYVFTRSGTTWSPPAQLVAPDGQKGDQFGNSVAIGGNTIVAGAYHEGSGSATRRGSAYVFTRSGTTWSPRVKLVAPDGQKGDEFGSSVAIDGNKAVVGAFTADLGSAVDRGSAYLFTRSGTTWSPPARLVAPDGQKGDQFGNSVAISGDTVVVGAFGDDTGTITDHGSAYVFTGPGTSRSQRKLTATGQAAGDWFGSSVAIGGDTVVAGAYGDDGSATNQGSAYVFTRSGTSWSEQDKLAASDGRANAFFGHSVAVSGDTVVAGASNFASSGSAYVFLSDADGDGVADAEDNCPLTSNPDQADTDGDSLGDACDADDDGDGVADAEDNCPLTSNPDQADTDGDSLGDACDPDDDNDTVADGSDSCAAGELGWTSNATSDHDGDGCRDASEDTDDDDDSVADGADNCPLDANPAQEDSDADGIGDACDPNPTLFRHAPPELSKLL